MGIFAKKKLVRVETQFTQEEKQSQKIQYLPQEDSRKPWKVLRKPSSASSQKVQTFPRPLNRSRKSLNVLVTKSIKIKIYQKSTKKFCEKQKTL